MSVFVCPPVCLCVCLSVCLYVCLPVALFVYLFVSLSACLYGMSLIRYRFSDRANSRRICKREIKLFSTVIRNQAQHKLCKMGRWRERSLDGQMAYAMSPIDRLLSRRSTKMAVKPEEGVDRGRLLRLVSYGQCGQILDDCQVLFALLAATSPSSLGSGSIL